MPLHTNAPQERHGVVRPIVECRLLLVDVFEVVGPRQPIDAGMGVNLDPGATPARSNLEPRAAIGEGVRPGAVDEPHREQELRIELVAMVAVADLSEIQLIPLVGIVRRRAITLVAILDPVAQGIARTRHLPGKEPARRVRIGDGRRIAPVRTGHGGPARAVGRKPAVLASDFPVVVLRIVAVLDAREESFGPRPIASRPGRRAGHGNEVFGSRQHEGVARIVVAWRPARGLPCDAGKTESPASAEWPVSATGAVDERELGLRAVAAGGERDRNREVASAREEYR